VCNLKFTEESDIKGGPPEGEDTGQGKIVRVSKPNGKFEVHLRSESERNSQFEEGVVGGKKKKKNKRGSRRNAQSGNAISRKAAE